MIDFKTDHKPDELTESVFEECLKKRYQVQLDYYRQALEQMTKKKVKQVILYSVSLGKGIECV